MWGEEGSAPLQLRDQPVVMFFFSRLQSLSGLILVCHQLRTGSERAVFIVDPPIARMSEKLGFIKAGLLDKAKQYSIDLGLKVELDPYRPCEFVY